MQQTTLQFISSVGIMGCNWTTKLLLILLVQCSLLQVVKSSICDTDIETWESLINAIEEPNNGGIIFPCPFTISGKGCPVNNVGYQVESMVELLCEPSGVDHSLCTIDCPGTHFEILSGGSLVLDGITLRGSENSAIRMYGKGSLLTINSVFENNTNNIGNGGAINAFQDSIVNIDSTRFQNNEGQRGGAIYLQGSAFIRGSVFLTNTAFDGGGGAIYVGRNGKTSLANNIFVRNNALLYGAAVFDAEGGITIQGKNTGCGNIGSINCNGVSRLLSGMEQCDDFNILLDNCPTSSPTTMLPSSKNSLFPSSLPSQKPNIKFNDITPIPSSPTNLPSDTLFPSYLPSSQKPSTNNISATPSYMFNDLVPTSSSSPTVLPSDTLLPSSLPSKKPSTTPSYTFTPTTSSLSPTDLPTLFPSSSLPSSQKPNNLSSATPSYSLYDILRHRLESYFVDEQDNQLFPGSDLQQKALDDCVFSDEYELLVNDLSDLELLERYVLNLFYSATKSQIDFRTKNKHVCEWGNPIHCGEEKKFVTAIVIGSNYGLYGTLPTEIGLLTNLAHLDIEGNNDLVGNIPTEIGKLQMLKELHLGKNLLKGSIPSEIGELSQLQSLELNDNKLTGNIPTEIENLHQSLYSIQLHGNNLSGLLPPEIGNLSLLKVLNLSSNTKLSGPFPVEMKNLTALENVYLFDTNLEGNLDSIICDQISLSSPAEFAASCFRESVVCNCCTYCCENATCIHQGF